MLKSLYSAISQKLTMHEIDQEVKQNSIISIAQILMVSHQHFSTQELDVIVNSFVDKLQNELTRDATLKALSLMAGSGQQGQINLQNLSKLTPHILSLLNKNKREIHLNAFEALLAMITRYPNQFSQ